MDKGGQVGTFILDFEKAFDTPPLELLKCKLFGDPQEICTQWGLYFSSFYTASEGRDFDEVHFNNVTSFVDVFKQDSVIERDVPLVTELEVNDLVSDLNRGKGCGEDKVDNEHIIYSGRKFRKYLATFLTACL